jgi:hypothetical protein
MRRGAALAVAAAVAVWVVARWVVYDYFQLGDTRVYEHAARLIDAGAVPYRDFDVEYPPLATGLFWLVGRAPGDYRLAFSLAMMACLAAAAVATSVAAARLGLGLRRRLVAVGLVCLAPLILGTLLQTRYDLVVTALLAAMLAAGLSGRFGWAWGALGVAIALKLVPVLLIPVLFIWHASARGRPAARGGLAATGVGVVATVLPALLIAPAGAWRAVEYHLARPPEIESLAAAVVQAIGLPARQVGSFGSENVEGTAAAVLSAVTTLLVAVLVVAIALRVRRGLRRRPDAASALAVQGVAATLVAAVAFAKVLSPQYVVWLLPATLLIEGRRGWAAAALTTAAMGATQVVFPLLYDELVGGGDAAAITALCVRNGLLLALLWVVWPRTPAASAVAADTPIAAGGGLPQWTASSLPRT